MTIWWVLIGEGLGEPEDEDNENDSSAGAGGGGVCDGGGGGEELMVGPAWPHEKRKLKQWKVTKKWRWGSVVKAWE